MNRGYRMAAVLSLLAVGAGPALTPASVERSIRIKGPRRTIDDLVRRDLWETVTNHMDTGSPAWIALVPKLAPGSDAGSAEDLGLSLAFALPRNPAAVLAAIDPVDGAILGVRRVCNRPFIEDTEPRGYKARTLAALGGIHDGHLERRRVACLRVLRAT